MTNPDPNISFPYSFINSQNSNNHMAIQNNWKINSSGDLIEDDEEE